MLRIWAPSYEVETGFLEENMGFSLSHSKILEQMQIEMANEG